jgi:hypothetical protein
MKLITGTGSSPGCIRDREIDRAPSSRGGVPVLRRPSRQLQFAQSRAERFRRRLAGAPRLVMLEADVDQPDKNVPS